MILSQPQAEAVYGAMCALSRVSAACVIVIPGQDLREDIHVNTVRGDVFVRLGFTGQKEDFEDHTAFAIAYGLQNVAK